MKWLFFLLLLMNIGMFIWIYPQNQPADAGHTAVPPGVETLKLLSEVSATSRRQDQQVGAVDGEVPSDTDADAGEQAMAGESAAKTPVESADAEPSQAEGMGTLAQTHSPDKSAVRETQAPRSLEASGDEALSRSESAGEVSTAAETQCMRIGPLEKREQADGLSLRLRALELQPELQTEMSNEQEGYWVLIPPQADRETAMAIVERLRDAGVSDLWRFTSGSLAHAISLGLFRHESRAEVRRQDIVGMGFAQAEVRPRYRQKTRYWLAIDYTGDAPIPDERWREMLERYPTIEQIQIPCD